MLLEPALRNRSHLNEKPVHRNKEESPTHCNKRRPKQQLPSAARNKEMEVFNKEAVKTQTHTEGRPHEDAEKMAIYKPRRRN